LFQCKPKDRAVFDQITLFDADSPYPAGLRYAEEFVSREVELQLIAHVAALPLQPFQFGAFEGKRRVASFGFRYDYGLPRLQNSEPVPSWLGDVIERVDAFGGEGTRIAQVLCTEYATGVGIGWHRDRPHFGNVFGLSLASSCHFRFRRALGDKWERFTLEAEPRSLYMMSGPSREVWEHSIPPVEAPRTSVTFRTMAERQ
jgi:alkylated DNA repair dioxygenase AlkB